MKHNFTSKCAQWLKRPAWIKGFLAILVVLLVGGWRGLIIWNSPRRLAEIARAHGYVGLFYGVPQVNANGSKIVYSEMSDRGIGIFLLDFASGRKVMVHEKVSLDDWFENADVWPWAPDGNHFIFTHTNLFVCDGVTGKAAYGLPVEGRNGVASLVWLDARSFVYVSTAGNLHRIEERDDQAWQEVENNHLKAGAQNLTAISTNTICWQKGNYIWSLDLVSNVARVLYHAQTNELQGFSYFRKSGQFLVNCTNDNGSLIQRMTIADNGMLENVEQVESTLLTHDVQWLDGEKGGCAYIGVDPKQPANRYIEIASESPSKSVKLFDRGTVDGIAASEDGKKLFVIGAVSNEPASSMWEYDTDSEKLRCVVPGSDYPSSYATRVDSQQITVNLGPDRTFNYHLYEPVGVCPSAHRRYPLVIGDTLFKVLDPAYQNRVHGPYWAPLLANAGAYVVIVERPGSWGNEMGYWEDYVAWVYKKMIDNPTIDPKQVFLYATSAETEHLGNLAKQNPQLWKGLILLNPVVLPDLQALSRAKFPPKILVDAGALEDTNRVNQYQSTALMGGVLVEYYTHPEQSHIPLGKRTLGERAENLTQFVFGD